MKKAREKRVRNWMDNAALVRFIDLYETYEPQTEDNAPPEKMGPGEIQVGTTENGVQELREMVQFLIKTLMKKKHEFENVELGLGGLNAFENPVADRSLMTDRQAELRRAGIVGAAEASVIAQAMDAAKAIMWMAARAACVEAVKKEPERFGMRNMVTVSVREGGKITVHENSDANELFDAAGVIKTGGKAQPGEILEVIKKLGGEVVQVPEEVQQKLGKILKKALAGEPAGDELDELVRKKKGEPVN